MPTLESLDMKTNSMSAVPPIFADMTRLILLNLSHNRFDIFPPPVERMTQIQILDLTGNGLTRLPYFIGRLVCATAILLGGNSLTVVPDSIGALGQVVLTSLNLSHNGLTRVPPALCNVLTLETVCLSGNSLDEVPSQMGRLASLKELWLDNNKLKLLPPTLGGWLKMQNLLLHNNQLKMVPKQLPELIDLQVLTLSGNLLTSLPWDLWKLTKLEEVWLDGNKLERLPEGIETMPSLKSLSCKHNPLFGEDMARVEKLMLLFPDMDGAMRLKEAGFAEARQRERLAVAEAARIHQDDDRPEDETRGVSDNMRQEMLLLQNDLSEALFNHDYEGADRIQSLIDEINQKIESGGAEGFGGGASGNQDSSTFTFQVEVLRCSGLISSSKKAPLLSPYVSLLFLPSVLFNFYQMDQK